jgi:translation initiation factor IF-3
MKEIRLRPKTNEHHRGFKVRNARGWLENGIKVKVTIRFRGREVTYPEIALEDLKEIAEELKDVSVIETAPSMEGRAMNLILAPAKEKEKKTSSEKKQKKNIEPAEKTEEKQLKKAE